MNVLIQTFYPNCANLEIVFYLGSYNGCLVNARLIFVVLRRQLHELLWPLLEHLHNILHGGPLFRKALCAKHCHLPKLWVSQVMKPALEHQWPSPLHDRLLLSTDSCDGLPAADELHEQNPEAPHIAAFCNFAQAVSGVSGGAQLQGKAVAQLGNELGQAEVRHQGVEAVVQENVAGFEVAMDDGGRCIMVQVAAQYEVKEHHEVKK